MTNTHIHIDVNVDSFIPDTGTKFGFVYLNYTLCVPISIVRFMFVVSMVLSEKNKAGTLS